MASYTKKRKKNDPSYRKRRSRGSQRSELVLNFALSETGTHYISIPYAMSIVNRKLFRSSRTYAVAGVSFYTQTASTSQSVRIATIPDNWPANNAIVKAYHLWKQMNDKVLDDNPSLKGKWSDFKPGFDEDHTVAWDAGVPSLRPIDAGSALSLVPAEWQQAEIVFPQHSVDLDPVTGISTPLPAVTRHLHVLGDDDAAKDTVGIIKGYESTRATVQAEDPADDSVDPSNWMITLFDEGSSDPELIGYVVEENDQPPYDQDDYPGATTNLAGGTFQTFMSVFFDPATGATQNSTHDSGFLAPLGLMKIEYSRTGAAGVNILQVRLVPGSYNGCMSESIV